MVAPTTNTILAKVADELGLSEEDLLRQGVRTILERRLRQVEAEMFGISGRYEVDGVAELEEYYRNGEVEEADSWRDLQRLDHLEYERDRLRDLLAEFS